ncbi:periphilin-1-like [Dipodomys merriami]|uniref:periphilin-1-like n=1 Tax=Dipodomys merriami TaxID=94247 RepID=UPI003855C180
MPGSGYRAPASRRMKNLAGRRREKFLGKPKARPSPATMRDQRDGVRSNSFYTSHYSWDHYPHKRDAAFFRESPGGRKDSPHSRSGSSVGSRSYSPERSKPYSFHQSQHRRRERSAQSLKTSGDTSTWSSSALPSSKRVPAVPLVTEKPEEPESNTTDWIELFEDAQLDSRSKAIASKMKEIERIYRQDCETFGMVVKMLIAKEPSLEQTIQFALRQNLQDIGKRCIEELKNFIAEYDNATQGF